MREQRIGILSIQETRLSDDECLSLNERYHNTLDIVNSSNPEDENNGGIAIAFNKTVLDTSTVKYTTLIPGRAIHATLSWHGNRKLCVVAVYAPSAGGPDNEEFWMLLRNKLAAQGNNLHKPDILLGDFNLVEDAPDRLPPHNDRIGSVIALRELRAALNLKDGWRETYPDQNAYTFFQTHRQGGRKSRIDRIYIHSSLLPFARDWDINSSGVHTDHKLVTARISAKDLPYIGRGRWSMPVFLIDDKRLQAMIDVLGKALQGDLEALAESGRSTEDNPQRAFKRFKDKVIALVRTEAKQRVPALERKARILKDKINATMNDGTLDEEEKRLTTSVLQD
ncbi:DNase I-like protein, partial [Coniophora puteana RWD-64-598 SS2]